MKQKKISKTRLLRNPNWIAIDGRKKTTYDIAVSSGAVKNLNEREGWFLDSFIKDMKYDGGNGETRILSRRKQFDDWLKIWENPVEDPYNLIISSSPNDIKAQMVALRLFLRVASLEGGKKRIVWHQVYGGSSYDFLRDSKRDPDISFIILSNIPDFSTVYKLEKTRDIISKYNSVPRVIITTQMLPIDLGRKLRIPTNYCINIGNTENRKGYYGQHRSGTVF